MEEKILTKKEAQAEGQKMARERTEQKKSLGNQDIADDFIGQPPYCDDLIYVDEYDQYYLWNGSFYNEFTQKQFERQLHIFIRNSFSNRLTMQIIKDVICQIKLCLPNNRYMDNPGRNYIAFKDGHFNLKTFKLEELSQDRALVFGLDFNFKDIFNCLIPNFDNFLRTSLVEKETMAPDEELIAMVQEMMGYFLLDTVEAKKGAAAFFLVGEGANGKSTLLDIIEAMVGDKFRSAMSIQEISTDKFACSDLVGKKINISNEEESKFQNSAKFKAIITGDPINARRPYGQQFNFRPFCKFIFASNDMPSFDSFNLGLKRRMRIIPFYQKFVGGSADKHLGDKLMAELPGIVAWALLGAKRFILNGYEFSSAKSSIEELFNLEVENSSTLSFLYDIYMVDKNGFVSNIDLYRNYKTWCQENTKKPVASNRFYKESMKMQDIESVVKWTSSGNARGKNLLLRYGNESEEYNQGVIAPAEEEIDTKTQSALENI